MGGCNYGILVGQTGPVNLQAANVRIAGCQTRLDPVS